MPCCNYHNYAMIKISIAIPTFKRTDLLYKSFQHVIDDMRIKEVVIIDDHSPMHIYAELEGFCKGNPKIKLRRNEDKNVDCYINKARAVANCTTEYCILLDSDNEIHTDYIDTIYEQHWSPERILQPSFASPHFNFKKFNGLLASKRNVSKYAGDSAFTTMLNACNFFVNCERYLEVWDGSVDPVTSDSIYFAYCWLNKGNSIHVVPGLTYLHRVNDHNGQEPSHYLKHNKRTPPGFHESIVKKLRQLR